jgi:transcriptional regulator with XRE-family HTH domain
MRSLSQYLSESAISQRDFALKVGVDKSIISRLKNNAMRPSLELAVQIERATGGAVLASSWIPNADAAGPDPSPEDREAAA